MEVLDDHGTGLIFWLSYATELVSEKKVSSSIFGHKYLALGFSEHLITYQRPHPRFPQSTHGRRPSGFPKSKEGNQHGEF